MIKINDDKYKPLTPDSNNDNNTAIWYTQQSTTGKINM